jgi:hypothetical protein
MFFLKDSKGILISVESSYREKIISKVLDEWKEKDNLDSYLKHGFVYFIPKDSSKSSFPFVDKGNGVHSASHDIESIPFVMEDSVIKLINDIEDSLNFLNSQLVTDTFSQFDLAIFAYDSAIDWIEIAHTALRYAPDEDLSKYKDTTIIKILEQLPNSRSDNSRYRKLLKEEAKKLIRRLSPRR